MQGNPALDWDMAAQLALTAPKEIGFREAISKTSTGRPTTAADWIGYASTARETMDVAGLVGDAAAHRAGELTPEREARLVEAVEFMSRPMNWKGKLGDLLQGSIVFAQEMVGGGALAKGAVKGAQRAGLLAVRDAVDDVAARSVAARLAKGAGEGIAIGLANEAVLAPFGGGHAPQEAWRQVFQSMDPSLSEDEAGELELAFSAATTDFWEAMPRALALALIEPVSERSGAALGKLTGYERLKGAMASVAQDWTKRTGKDLGAFGKFVQKAGWDGVVEEWLEERYGGALRMAIGEGGIEEVFPSLEDMAVELAGFATLGTTLGTAIRGADALLAPSAPSTGEASQAGKPDAALTGQPLGQGATERGATTQLEPVPEAEASPALPEPAAPSSTEAPLPGEEGPPLPEAELTRSLPSDVEGAATPDVEVDDSIRRVARAERQDPATYEEVEPETPVARVAAARMERAGLTPRFVRGLRAGGAFVKPGEVLLNPDMADPREFARHEQLHNWVAGKTEGEWLDFYRTLRRVDAQGLRKARTQHRADWMAQTGVDEAAYRAAHPRAALRLEEGFATYAQELYGYLELLESPEGAKHIQRIARGEPGLFQRLIEAVRRMFGGGNEARFEELQRELGIAVTPRAEAAVAAKMLKEALDTAARAPETMEARAARPEYREPLAEDVALLPGVAPRATGVRAEDTRAFKERRAAKLPATAVDAIVRSGGIDLRGLPENVRRNEGSEMLQRLREKEQGRGARRIIRGEGSKAQTRGLSPEAMARELEQQGFRFAEGEANVPELAEWIERELAGDPVLHPEIAGAVFEEMGEGEVPFAPPRFEERFAAARRRRGVPQAISPDVVKQAQRDAERAKAGEAIGRPDLATTTSEEDLAAFQTAVDEARNRAGEPAADEALARVQERAIRNVVADPEGATKRLLGKIKRGEPLDEAEVFELRHLTHSTAKLAMQTGDELAWHRAYQLHWAYRMSGTNQSRAFTARQSRFNREVLGEELMALILGRPTYRTSRRIDDINRQLAKATTKESRRKELEAELDALLTKEAKRNEKVYRALKREGFDPGTMTKFDWQDPATASQLMRIVSTNRADWRDKAREFLYASMLSFPFTHARNFSGNLVNLGLSKHVQDMVESAVNLVVKSPESPTYHESRAVMRSLIPGLKEAGRRLFQEYRYQDGVHRGFDAEDIAKLAEGVYGNAIGATKAGRTLFRPLRWISLDLLRAVDSAFRGYIAEVSTSQLALRQAKQEGLKGEALERRVQELKYDPAIVEEATQDELFLTFQQKADPDSIVGQTEKFAMWMRNKADSLAPLLGTLHFPFIRTPLRLVEQAVRRSPMAWLVFTVNLGRTLGRTGYPGGSKAAVTQAADALIAGFIFWGIYAMLDDEDELGIPVIQGAPEKDYRMRNLQYRLGGPFTMQIAGETFSYKQRDPIAGAVAATVDAVRAYRNKGTTEAAGAAVKAIYAGMRDATYLRTLSDVHALYEGRRTLPEYGLDKFITPWMPRVIQGTLRESDAVMRESRVREYEDKTRTQAAFTRLPYRLLPSASIAPPPKRDQWGRPIERTPVRVTNGFLLERISTSGDPLPIDRMLWKWNQKVSRGEVGEEAKQWAPTPPRTYTDKGGKRSIWDDDEYDELVRISGERAAERLLRLPLNWDDPVQADVDAVKKEITSAKAYARDVLLGRRR